MLKVLFFGLLQDVTQCEDWQSDAAADTGELLQKLENKWPALRGKTFSIAVNRKIQTEPVHLNDGDEVALLPPFSGG